MVGLVKNWYGVLYILLWFFLENKTIYLTLKIYLNLNPPTLLDFFSQNTHKRFYFIKYTSTFQFIPNIRTFAFNITLLGSERMCRKQTIEQTFQVNNTENRFFPWTPCENLLNRWRNIINLRTVLKLKKGKVLKTCFPVIRDKNNLRVRVGHC